MSSTAQILANQQNAQASTGPRTIDGKAASSRNAVTHGLTGGFRVLAHEDQKAYDACLASYIKDFQPETEHERFVVELMTQARWELQRVNRLMSCVLERLAQADANAASPDAAIAGALIARSADAYTTLKRYAASAERTYLRCSRELTTYRARRAKEADAVVEAKVCAYLTAPELPVRNEPNPARRTGARVSRPTPGVPFTENDPPSWRL